MLLKKYSFFLLLFLSQNIFAICIPLSGIKFEKVNDSTLLIIKDGMNFGLLEFLSIESGNEYSGFMPDSDLNIRFFMPTLCERPSPNADFMMGKKLFRARNIRVFQSK